MSQPSQRELIAAGFDNLQRTEQLLGSPELTSIDAGVLLEQISQAANPDEALILLIRLIERQPKLAELINQGNATGLVRLIGASEAQGEFLIRRSENLDLFLDPTSATPTAPALAGITENTTPVDGSGTLRTLLLQAVKANPEDEQPQATLTGKEAAVALRTAYRRQLVSITVNDVMAEDPLELQPVVSQWLADLAAAALEAALAVARTEAVEQFGVDKVDQINFTVMGLGKCGARELNYISDVDVIFAHSIKPVTDVPTRSEDDENPEEEIEVVSSDEVTAITRFLARGIAKAIQSPAPESGLWEVDMALRPEGNNGAFSRTVASHREYYQRWADTWEFQALLKARHLAGSPEVAEDYLAALQPMVWQASTREGFVAQVQNMRKRVIDNIKSKDRDREIKLGPGGLRDVEFPAQLLQLVHGKTDESLHVRSTEDALHALQAGGYIGRSQAAELRDHYRFLRLLEHRIQLAHMRRTHLLPDKPEALRVLARSVRGVGQNWPTDAEQLLERWQTTRRDVRALFEQIFYRPLLPSTAALAADQVALSSEAAKQRLEALGYQDARGALRHISALTEGVSRRAALQRQLLPAMLGWFAQGPNPDGGLLSFRKLSEALGLTPWYLRMLRDSADAAERLCQVLSTSRYIADLLEHTPEAASWLDSEQDLQPVALEAQVSQMQALISRHPDPAEAIRHIRSIRRREILRTAMADASGLLDIQQVGKALSNADQAAVVAAMEVVESEFPDRNTQLAVIAMGRQGGREIGYGSDLDVMFVHQPFGAANPDETSRQAVEMAKRLTNLFKTPVKPALPLEPVLLIDADLRPEGKRGPLVRSLEGYQNYYEQWAEIWEIQALLKARPVAGDSQLQQDFMSWADSARYTNEVSDQQLHEIRRIKARVEAERLPRGADPTRHLKLGRGSLSDVEWLVQTIQLQHAARYEQLRTPSTLKALEAISELKLLPDNEVATLKRAWVLATQIRSATVIASGRGSDVLPTNRETLAAVAQWCGYNLEDVNELEEDYLRITRRARQVFEERFYGISN